MTQGDSNYVLILQWVDGNTLENLFDHTRRVRAQRLRESGEALNETAVLPDRDYADSVTAARTTQNKSRLPSRSSGGQGSKVPDFWHFSMRPTRDWNLAEKLMNFVDNSWAFHTVNSGDVRFTKEFKELEDRFQTEFASQSWQNVRPWIFFSACTNGMTSHVQAWMQAFPQLARTTQDYPIRTTALVELCESHLSEPEIAKIAKILIDNGSELYHVPGSGAENSLCYAVKHGKEAITLLLLEKRPDLITFSGSTTSSPLDWVLVSNPANALSIVRILLNHGASPNEICDKFYRSRPLHLAAKRQNSGVIEFLLDSGAFIDAQDSRGLTPLAIAILEDNIECCRLLLARGAQAHFNDVQGDSLFVHTELHNPLIAELLLQYGADINARNDIGESALHLAARDRGRADSVIRLIKWGIDLNATNRFGETALHYASCMQDTKVAKRLIASGADVNITDIFGHKPLWVAVFSNCLDAIKLLIKKTRNIDQIDYKGQTVLSTGASFGDREIVDLLLDAGAQIAPREAGPHCPFLDPEERMIGYFEDPVLAALGRGHFDIAKAIMERAGGGDERSEFAEALQMLDNGDLYGLKRWSTTRFRNASANQPGIIAMRKEVIARADNLIRENDRRMAAELGIAYVERWHGIEQNGIMDDMYREKM